MKTLKIFKLSLPALLLVLLTLPNSYSKETPNAAELPILAIYDFRAYEASEVLAKTITEKLYDELFHRGVYRVVARNDMQSIFKEQGFQLSGACDDASCLVEIGRVLGAEFIAGGSVSQVDEYFTVTVRVIDVESSQVVSSSSTSKYFLAEDLLNRGIEELVDGLLSGKRKKQWFTSPYFWGGAVCAVAAGTAVYLSSQEDNSKPVSNNASAEVIVVFP
ncbi:MAG: hypothetical protein H8E46_10260 [FCB group bacterium]|nr:hypothetical protein [FCB group bacterium]